MLAESSPENIVMRLLPSPSILILSVVAFYSSTAIAQTVLPGFVKPACEFSYQKDSNGNLPTPNNAGFPGLRVCEFYNQAMQMFIWLTSPSQYGGGKYVFTSPIFNLISTPRDGMRYLAQADSAIVSPGFFDVTLPQDGPTGSLIVFDIYGMPHDLVYPRFVRTGSGEMIEIARVRRSLDRSSIFIDKNGNVIKSTKESKILDKNLNDITPSGKTIQAGGKLYQTDVKGDAIGYGPGQAETHKVLMSQTKKLVYYGILINDVYAAFHASSPNQSPTGFPTTKEDINGLGGPFPDADALAVAVKTAWIEVDDDKKEEYQKKYLTIDAMIPTYKRQSDYVWTPTHMAKPATLALVGMHVAFSAKNFPQMIWATFESIYNTRNRDYKYFDEDGNVRTQSEDVEGNWLFSNKGNDFLNVARMYVDESGQIVGDTDKNSIQLKIGPSNIRREYPWGADHVGESEADTDIISINKSVACQLSAADVRRRYIMRGAIWLVKTVPGAQGSLKLANSTMETFVPNSNCLGCHRGGMLSHIWDKLSPTRQ
jgi:hypothetical protein